MRSNKSEFAVSEVENCVLWKRHHSKGSSTHAGMRSIELRAWGKQTFGARICDPPHGGSPLRILDLRREHVAKHCQRCLDGDVVKCANPFDESGTIEGAYLVSGE
jgi:hypothetical protein